jgi:hypothetical protein
MGNVNRLNTNHYLAWRFSFRVGNLGINSGLSHIYQDHTHVYFSTVYMSPMTLHAPKSHTKYNTNHMTKMVRVRANSLFSCEPRDE